MIDFSRPYGEVFGVCPYRYEQDGLKYTAQGELYVDPVAETADSEAVAVHADDRESLREELRAKGVSVRGNPSIETLKQRLADVAD